MATTKKTTKKQNDLLYLRSLNLGDLRKVYKHSCQVMWTISNYGVSIKQISSFVSACQNELKRRGKEI